MVLHGVGALAVLGGHHARADDLDGPEARTVPAGHLRVCFLFWEGGGRDGALGGIYVCFFGGRGFGGGEGQFS